MIWHLTSGVSIDLGLGYEQQQYSLAVLTDQYRPRTGTGTAAVQLGSWYRPVLIMGWGCAVCTDPDWYGLPLQVQIYGRFSRVHSGVVWGYIVQLVTANHATRVNIWVSFGVNDTWLCHTYNRPFIFCLEAYWQHWYCHYWSAWRCYYSFWYCEHCCWYGHHICAIYYLFMGTMGAGIRQR